MSYTSLAPSPLAYSPDREQHKKKRRQYETEDDGDLLACETGVLPQLSSQEAPPERDKHDR